MMMLHVSAVSVAIVYIIRRQIAFLGLHFIHIFTRHTERSRVWNGTLVSVFALSGYRCLGDSGTVRREILHDDTYRSRRGFLPFWGGAPVGDPKIRNFGPKF